MYDAPTSGDGGGLLGLFFGTTCWFIYMAFLILVKSQTW